MAKIKGKNLGRTTQLVLTPEQHKQLQEGGLTTGVGSPQETYRRVAALVRTHSGKPVAHVTDRELEGLRKCAQREGTGGWQDWARAVFMANNFTW